MNIDTSFLFQLSGVLSSYQQHQTDLDLKKLVKAIYEEDVVSSQSLATKIDPAITPFSKGDGFGKRLYEQWVELKQHLLSIPVQTELF